MEFYDLYVPAEKPEEVVETAKEFGFSGIAVTHEYTHKEGLNSYLGKIDSLGSGADIDIIRSCVLDPDSTKEMKKQLGGVRQRVEIVCVNGGNFEVNKAAVQDSRVDILLHPEYKRKDPGMDHKTARMASENSVAIGFVFHDLHQTYGKVRAHVLNHMKKSLELCEKYGVDFIVTSGARNRYELRGGRDLASLVKVLDVDASEAISSVTKTPSSIVSENRKKLGGSIKKDGVEEI